MKDPKTGKEIDEAEVVDLETLEKGLNKSLAGLQTLLKAKKPEPDMEDEEEDEDEEEPDDDEDDYEEEDEEEPKPKKPMHKSLNTLISEDDPEADIAMDVAPFLKSFTVGVEQYIDQAFAKLEKSLQKQMALTKALGEVTLASSELQKSLQTTVTKIGKTPIPSRSAILQKSGRFAGGGDDKMMDGRAILAKSFDLVKAGKLTTLQATKIEHRVNAGQDLPEELAHLFEAK